MIKNAYRSTRNVRVIFVRFKLNLNFLGIFSKNNQISHLMKILYVGPELFHVDGRTDITNMIGAIPLYCINIIVY
jgi:hypothetical protein